MTATSAPESSLRIPNSSVFPSGLASGRSRWRRTKWSSSRAGERSRLSRRLMRCGRFWRRFRSGDAGPEERLHLAQLPVSLPESDTPGHELSEVAERRALDFEFGPIAEEPRLGNRFLDCDGMNGVAGEAAHFRAEPEFGPIDI